VPIEEVVCCTHANGRVSDRRCWKIGSLVHCVGSIWWDCVRCWLTIFRTGLPKFIRINHRRTQCNRAKSRTWRYREGVRMCYKYNTIALVVVSTNPTFSLQHFTHFFLRCAIAGELSLLGKCSPFNNLTTTTGAAFTVREDGQIRVTNKYLHAFAKKWSRYGRTHIFIKAEAKKNHWNYLSIYVGISRYNKITRLPQ
jgi:hypothetical protein